jgi:polyisoprenoid-binding protein YceI
MPGLRVAALLSALAGAPAAVPPADPRDEAAGHRVTQAVGTASHPASTDASTLPPHVFDPARSQARFKVRMRILPAATGHFLDVRGQLQPDGEGQRVEVEIDGRKLRFAGPAWMNKVTRSDDFLAVDKHPRIVFRSDAFAPAMLRDGGQLRGELTLRGETRAVAFNVAPAACATPGRDCDIVVTGRVSRQAFGMHAYRLTVRDGVDFEFQVRLLPEPGAAP